MSSVTCKICDQEIQEDNLKHWWADHKLKMADYFVKYYDKRSLLTNEPLEFKSIDNYLLSDFANKNELKKWLKLQNINKQREYLREILVKRKESKQLIKALSQFESRDLMIPAVSYYNKIFDNKYNELCQSIGMRPVFDYNQELEFDNKRKFKIITDTRESKPLSFNKEILVEKLDVGDYCSRPLFQDFVIERKEISDWAGTMSKGHERFCRELNRAKELGIYVIMVIESSYSDLQSINYLPHTKHIQASSEFLFKRTRDLFVNYDNFQTCAIDGRKNTANLIEKLFKVKNDIKTVDIQYMLDIKKL